MSDVVQEIARLEKELLALTGNQPPNPANLTTYRVDRTSTMDFEYRTVQFVSGTPSYLQLYGDALLLFISGDIVVRADNGVSYTVISLGDFNLV